MSLRVPDTLVSQRSEKYIVSIRLWSDGLSFSGYIPSERGSVFHAATELDATQPYLHALKDIFSTHPFLTSSYRKIYVVCANAPYTLAPEHIFAEKEKEQLMSFVFSADNYKVLHESLGELEAELVFGINPDIYDFCVRSLNNPQFTHAVSSLLIQWRKQSLAGVSKQLSVVLHEKTMDAACFERGALLFVNSFAIDTMEDVMYCILSIWKQTGMDQEKDVLFLSAPPILFDKLKEILHTYLLRIETVPVSEMDEKLPLDIKALFQCGL
ncbi:MAG: DUF3822 family protein [Tannerella sp.]|jgi:hypothetical protein|nr:DUF3822 family protein [Tannerella sp.]